MMPTAATGHCSPSTGSEIQLTAEGRERLEKAPEYLEKFRDIIVEEGGLLGLWDVISIVKYPDNASAFRALAKIGKLEVVKTETFPIETIRSGAPARPANRNCTSVWSASCRMERWTGRSGKAG